MSIIILGMYSININGQCIINLQKDPVTVANFFNNFLINIGKEYSKKFKNKFVDRCNITCKFSFKWPFLIHIDKNEINNIVKI